MKKYLKDMNKEELKKVFDNSAKIQEYQFNIVLENNMNLQQEYGKMFFGENWYEYIEIHDHYSTFYLKLKSAYKFFDNLGKDVADYLSVENAQTFQDIYKKAKKYYININTRCNYGSNKYYENIEKLEEECNKLLEILENELHSFENIDNNEVFESFCDDVYDNNIYDGLYIENNDYTHIYEYINYIKEW